MNKQFTKLLFISLLLIGFFANYALSQQAVLKGVVTDGDAEEPLIGATIKVGDMGTTTDFDGSYELKLSPGTHTIIITYVGFSDYKEEITIAGGEKTLDVTLSSGVMLEELIVTTEKGQSKSIMEAIGTIEVISPQLASNTASVSVDDVLEKVPGVTIIDGQANIRGGSGYSYGAGSRVLLLIDGIPALAGDAAFPNWDDVPVENIDQVEILKGAGSALYGSSALNGIINVKTAFAKSEPETNFSSFITYYMDPSRDSVVWWSPQTQPHDFGASLAHRQKFGKLDFVLGSYFVQENGFRKGVHNRYLRGNIGLRYRITDKFAIGLNTNVNTGNSENFLYWQGIDSLAYHGEAGTETATEKLRYTIDPYINYMDNQGNRHRLQGRFYSVENDNSNNQSNSSQLYYGEYQFVRTFDGPGVTITAGLVGIRTSVQAELYSDTTFSSSNISAYMQADKKFFEHTGRPLGISFGARYENNVINTPTQVDEYRIEDGKTREGAPVFRFGANYKAFEHTSFRASWGQGYRFPTVAEKFVRTSAGLIQIFPNPELESETGWNAEIGMKQGFQFPGTALRGLFDVSLFWTEYQDMMEFTFSTFLVPGSERTITGFQSKNIGDTRIRGVDISLGGQGELFDNTTISFIGGYTYIDPQFKEWDIAGKETVTFNSIDTAPRGEVNAFTSSSDQNILKYRFEHTIKFDLQATFYGLTAGAAFNYYSNMEAIDQIFNQFIPGLIEWRDTHKEIKVVDFRLGYNFNENLKINFLMKNALNKEYAIRPGIINAPRNITLRLDYKF